MNPNDYFDIAQFLVNANEQDFPFEIFFRTAINRLYYGIFHLVQFRFKILIPKSEVKRCHAYVKEQIEQTNIRGDYSELEAYRVEVDYQISKKVNRNHYNDALKIQQRLLSRIEVPKYVPYEENDEKFFFKHKEF